MGQFDAMQNASLFRPPACSFPPRFCFPCVSSSQDGGGLTADGWSALWTMPRPTLEAKEEAIEVGAMASAAAAALVKGMAFDKQRFHDHSHHRPT